MLASLVVAGAVARSVADAGIAAAAALVAAVASRVGSMAGPVVAATVAQTSVAPVAPLRLPPTAVSRRAQRVPRAASVVVGAVGVGAVATVRRFRADRDRIRSSAVTPLAHLPSVRLVASLSPSSSRPAERPLLTVIRARCSVRTGSRCASVGVVGGVVAAVAIVTSVRRVVSRAAAVVTPVVAMPVVATRAAVTTAAASSATATRRESPRLAERHVRTYS